VGELWRGYNWGMSNSENNTNGANMTQTHRVDWTTQKGIAFRLQNAVAVLLWLRTFEGR